MADVKMEGDVTNLTSKVYKERRKRRKKEEEIKGEREMYMYIPNSEC